MANDSDREGQTDTGRALRVVSLLGAASEVMAALSLAHLLVGRSHECKFPPSLLELPCVSSPALGPDLEQQSCATVHDRLSERVRKGLSRYHVDVEAIRRLQPDVIITQDACDVCAVTSSDLQAACAEYFAQRDGAGRACHVVSLRPMSASDVWDNILQIAAAVGHNDKGRALVGNLQARWARVRAQVPRGAEGACARPRVVCLQWVRPLMGAGYWVPEIVACAGGESLSGKVRCGGVPTIHSAIPYHSLPFPQRNPHIRRSPPLPLTPISLGFRHHVLQPPAHSTPPHPCVPNPVAPPIPPSRSCQPGERTTILSFETLVSLDPDVIITMCCGVSREAILKELLTSEDLPQWNRLRAVQRDAVFVADGDRYFNNSGPTLVDSAEIMLEMLHAHRFQPHRTATECSEGAADATNPAGDAGVGDTPPCSSLSGSNANGLVGQGGENLKIEVKYEGTAYTHLTGGCVEAWRASVGWQE
ncbi:unnamed protein product [Closterium sp. Yama58-4]|nr:unnamed protein product [Closterium sp. Yama58-4]